RHGSAADERPAGLEHEQRPRQVVELPGTLDPIADRADPLVDAGRRLVAGVGDAEPAADVQYLRSPAELGAAFAREGGQPVNGEPVRRQVEHLRADVDVEAVDLEAGGL